MKELTRSFLYSLTIVSVLLMSTIGTTVVYADGGTSTDPASQESPITPPDVTTEDEPSTDQAQESQPPSEEPPTEVIETTPVEESPAAETITVPEILEQTPGETTLIILNEEGSAEPLATQKAAEILAEADPMWCPAGQVPTPGANGCTTNHATFNLLITDLTGGPYAGNGVIWVDSAYQGDDNSPINFDGSPGNLDNLVDITIQGGWNGASGSTSTDPNNPSMADVPMSFTNWTGVISINNLDFENALDDIASLNVNTDGNITLNNVSVTGNTEPPPNDRGHSARLDNCQEVGGVCTASGNVSVKNSSFSSNDLDGIYIKTDGNITLDNVTASDNLEDGIDQSTLDGNGNNFKITDVKVTNNGNDGLEIDDVDGNITMKNITATGNGADGVEIDDTFGNVYGTNITATGNGSVSSADGIDIHNTGGNLTLYNSTASNNVGSGIEIVHVNGNTKLKCITALNNGEDGAYINTSGNVAVKCSQFKDNTEDGLQIQNAPTAQLLSVSAARNGAQDININKNVTYVTKKEIDCSGKKTCESCKSTSTQDYYTTLVCAPTETTATLFDTSGDEVFFDNLCGYDAGIFDKTTRNIPKTIPGASEYISDLYAKLLEYLAEIQENGDQEAVGKYAMLLYDLAYVIPDDYGFHAGLLAVVLENGIYLDPLPEGAEVTVKFQMPEGLDADEELTILWWDGTDWDDLGGEVSEDGLFFQTTTDKTGVFVLAVNETD